jgi:hypothetical protein
VDPNPGQPNPEFFEAYAGGTGPIEIDRTVGAGNGNNFHMTEHLTTVACTDDPNIIQAPPPAPLDTLIGVGTGRFNGVDGFTVEFTLQDWGEPGGLDKMAIRIFQGSNVVLNIPLSLLANGNLQAHFDQPHR